MSLTDRFLATTPSSLRTRLLAAILVALLLAPHSMLPIVAAARSADAGVRDRAPIAITARPEGKVVDRHWERDPVLVPGPFGESLGAAAMPVPVASANCRLCGRAESAPPLRPTSSFLSRAPPLLT